MWRSTIRDYLKLTWLCRKSSIESAMSYRASFIAQVFGMFANDFCWLIVWMLFFTKFPSVNGWGLHDTMLLYAFGTVVYSFYVFLGDGIFVLPRQIVTGELDTYLVMPKNLLWSVAMSNFTISALGDGLFGITLMVITLGFAPLHIAFFLFIAMLSSIIFLDFVLIISSLAFWLGDIEDVTHRLVIMFVSLMFYPRTIYTGLLKLLTMTVFPAFFAVMVPLELIHHFSWTNFAILIASVMVGTTFAVWLFYKGLDRYESGNLMTMRQ